jgi:Sec-independent protein translocase protein TatA
MTSGVGFSEILLIFMAMVIFVKPKDIPEVMRRIFKVVGQLRAVVKKFIDEIEGK